MAANYGTRHLFDKALEKLIQDAIDGKGEFDAADWITLTVGSEDNLQSVSMKLTKMSEADLNEFFTKKMTNRILNRLQRFQGNVSITAQDFATAGMTLFNKQGRYFEYAVYEGLSDAFKTMGGTPQASEGFLK